VNVIFDKWFKTFKISLISYKKSWSINGVGKIYRIRTNGATLRDRYFDFYIEFRYLNFNFCIHDMNNNKLIKLFRRLKNGIK